MEPFQDLQTLSASKLLEAIASRAYEPPLSLIRDRIPEIAAPLRTIILILDFDTEVCMNGMLGFLENSTGEFLTETIDAFGRIGAGETESVLRSISKLLDDHHVTHAMLRSDFYGVEHYQITSWQELHGHRGELLPTEIEQVAKRLYLYQKPNAQEPIWELLEAFVATHRLEIAAEVDRIHAGRL
jgi:hypothetical protein